MDDDFQFDDPDNELDDDFVMQAMGGGGGDDEEFDEDDEEGSDIDSEFGGGRSDDEEDDDVPSLKNFSDEETGTRFTNYSMSSSCIRRNEGLSLLDDKFDRFVGRQYGELDDGALEGEDIEGGEGEEGQRMADILKEHGENKRKERQQLARAKEVSLATLAMEEGTEKEELETISYTDADTRWTSQALFCRFLLLLTLSSPVPSFDYKGTFFFHLVFLC